MTSPVRPQSLYTAAFHCTEKIRAPDLPALERDFEPGEVGIIGMCPAQG
jgi:hypothetical protein